ncbi:hypothetical protein LZ518_04725 [Sphingomonas sp. RB56-2]|uniref:Outer membrane protein assembly factor BamE n=1 Tax=Sphingomonas brevis TaxID=2908206 RepID=A0ABT0S7S7_9SPHN|nr:hypothetical protein [Sphingomonas brevis]MCL6740434.1 hypothetical protein [Sphingomonas brevis]
MTRVLVALALAALCAPVAAQESPNTLTHGMVQMTLHVGQTTRAEVLETFGGPNVTTLDGDGREVWMYDRFATVSATKDSGFRIGILGGVGGDNAIGGAGLGFGKSKSKSSTSTRSMTLILKFGPDGRLVDFKSRSSSF